MSIKSGTGNRNTENTGRTIVQESCASRRVRKAKEAKKKLKTKMKIHRPKVIGNETKKMYPTMFHEKRNWNIT
jgi:hypothetical protein